MARVNGSSQVTMQHSAAREVASPQRDALMSLLHAIHVLERRGPGNLGWAAPFRDDPLAFVLDSVSDAMNVWSDQQLLYSNEAAVRLGLGRPDGAALEDFWVRGRHFERRCMHCNADGRTYVIEIIRELEPEW